MAPVVKLLAVSGQQNLCCTWKPSSRHVFSRDPEGFYHYCRCGIVSGLFPASTHPKTTYDV